MEVEAGAVWLPKENWGRAGRGCTKVTGIADAEGIAESGGDRLAGRVEVEGRRTEGRVDGGNVEAGGETKVNAEVATEEDTGAEVPV